MQGKTLDFLLRCQAGLVYTFYDEENFKNAANSFPKMSF